VLSAIADASAKNLEDVGKNCKGVQLFGSLDEVLNADLKINAVAIATPAATHYALAKKALLAGKDVFVEKPLALQVSEAEELESIAREHGRILMVDHLLRYHPAVNKIKELIDNGTLGQLRYIYSNRLNIGRLRREENALWSFAPHDISVILYLAGEEPLSVSANGEAFLQKNIYDVTMTHLEFSDRLRAHVFVSWLHPFKEQRFVVVGDKNMAVFDDVQPKEKLVLYPHRVEWLNRFPVAAKAEKEVVTLDGSEPLKSACSHFLDCVTQRTAPLTDGSEGVRVLRVLNQAQDCLDRRETYVH
jgi:UDP-2-acetamido-3-amino-2,3-dideoxy-glucuronate N-acetyltransferase